MTDHPHHVQYSFISTVQICSDWLLPIVIWILKARNVFVICSHLPITSCYGVEIFLPCTVKSKLLLFYLYICSYGEKQLLHGDSLSLLVWGTTIRIVVSREKCHTHKVISWVAGLGCRVDTVLMLFWTEYWQFNWNSRNLLKSDSLRG